MKTIRTTVMSLAMLVSSALGLGGGVAIAHDDFRPEHHRYQERYDSYQDGYYFAFRHGFYDGLHGRPYENRANTRGEYLGYEEGYWRGKARLAFRQTQFPW